MIRLRSKAKKCPYCGQEPRKRGRIACHAHADLPAIDPYYSPQVPQKLEPKK